MRTVSLSFVITIAVLGVAAVTLSYLAPSPLYTLMALALAFYGLHLVALRTVLRWKLVPAEHSDIVALRAELEQQRTELSAERADLHRQKEAAEQQWLLLRDMVRERVEKSQLQAPAESRTAATPIRGEARRESSSGRADAQSRTSGRW